MKLAMQLAVGTGELEFTHIFSTLDPAPRWSTGRFGASRALPMTLCKDMLPRIHSEHAGA